jgi:hypothetical protein
MSAWESPLLPVWRLPTVAANPLVHHQGILAYSGSSLGTLPVLTCTARTLEPRLNRIPHEEGGGC